MEFRINNLARSEQSAEKFPIFEHLDDIVNKTLCAKAEGQSYHLRECLNRECESCGVEKCDLMKEEDVSPLAPTVSWQKFEYVTIGKPKGLGAREKETSTGQKRNYSWCHVQQFENGAA